MTALLAAPIVLPLLAAALCILAGASRTAQRVDRPDDAHRAGADRRRHPDPRRRPRRRRRPGRGLAGTARHHARRRPALGDHAGDGHRRAAGRARLRHRPARRRAQPRRVPVVVHDPGRGRVGVVPHRRPVHPVRRHRDDADRELRADHARRSARPGPRRDDLRRHQPHRVGAVPGRAGAHYAATGTVNMADLGGRDRRAPERAAGRPRRAVPRRVRHQGGDRPALLLAARQLPDAHRRRSPRSSPACSPRSGSTPSSAPRRCSSRRTPGSARSCWCRPASRWSSASSGPSPRRTCGGSSPSTS